MKTEYPIVIAGDNFGCGSSREHAPVAMGASGTKVVVAESYARIFFRNCVATYVLLLCLFLRLSRCADLADNTRRMHAAIHDMCFCACSSSTPPTRFHAHHPGASCTQWRQRHEFVRS